MERLGEKGPQRREAVGAFGEPFARDVGEGVKRAFDGVAVDLVSWQRSLEAPQRLERAHGLKHLGRRFDDRGHAVEVERELLALRSLGDLGGELDESQQRPALEASPKHPRVERSSRPKLVAFVTCAE
jgi:hypothetical protein